MPWIAVHDGEKKAPRQVPIKTDVDCPECGECLGELPGWTERIFPTEQGALVANNTCPYCGVSIWLTADNRIVVIDD